MMTPKTRLPLENPKSPFTYTPWRNTKKKSLWFQNHNPTFLAHIHLYPPILVHSHLLPTWLVHCNPIFACLVQSCLIYPISSYPGLILCSFYYLFMLLLSIHGSGLSATQGGRGYFHPLGAAGLHCLAVIPPFMGQFKHSKTRVIWVLDVCSIWSYVCHTQCIICIEIF